MKHRIIVTDKHINQILESLRDADAAEVLQLSEEEIADYALGILDPEEHERVERALANSPADRAELQSIIAMLNAEPTDDAERERNTQYEALAIATLQGPLALLRSALNAERPAWVRARALRTLTQELPDTLSSGICAALEKLAETVETAAEVREAARAARSAIRAQVQQVIGKERLPYRFATVSIPLETVRSVFLSPLSNIGESSDWTPIEGFEPPEAEGAPEDASSFLAGYQFLRQPGGSSLEVTCREAIADARIHVQLRTSEEGRVIREGSALLRRQSRSLCHATLFAGEDVLTKDELTQAGEADEKLCTFFWIELPGSDSPS